MQETYIYVINIPVTDGKIMKKYVLMLLALAHMAYGSVFQEEGYTPGVMGDILATLAQHELDQQEPTQKIGASELFDVEAIREYNRSYPEDTTTGREALLRIATDRTYPAKQWEAILSVESNECNAEWAKYKAIEKVETATLDNKAVAEENLDKAKKDLAAALEDIKTILPEIISIANTERHYYQWEAIKIICFSPAIQNKMDVLPTILPGIISVANNSTHQEQWEAIKIICFADDAAANDSIYPRMRLMYFPDVPADCPVRDHIKTHMSHILSSIRSIAEDQGHPYQEYAAMILAAPR